jgi:hypothetical protein
MLVPTLDIATSCRHSLSKGSVDTTLSGNGMRSSGEQLGDTGSVEAGLGKTEGGSQTSTAGADDESIVFVVNDGVLVAEEWRGLLCAKGLVCDDTSGGGAAREGAGLLSSEALGELQYCCQLPVFKRPFWSWTHPRRSGDLSQTE